MESIENTVRFSEEDFNEPTNSKIVGVCNICGGKYGAVVGFLEYNTPLEGETGTMACAHCMVENKQGL